MNEAWFPVWFGGALGGGVGLLGAIYGCTVGYCAPRGVAKGPVFAMHYGILLLGIISLIVAVVAYWNGQPFSDWYSFGLCGVLLAILMTAFTPMLNKQYREAEERRLAAKDLLA